MQTTKPETAQQRPTGARMALLMLLYFIKIGAFTFGSGWSIIAQMEREFVDERGWMTRSDLLELIAVGKSLPGIMVANITLLFGYQMAGALGGICAAIGLCHPRRRHPYHRDAISDEVYHPFVFGETFGETLGGEAAVAPSIAAVPGMKDRTIVVESLSKTYAMTGWRIGYLLAPEAVIEQTGKIAELMHSSVNSLAQYAGVAALAGPQDHVAAMREEYRAKRQIVLDGLAGCPVLRLIEPQGAFYAFVDVRLTGLDSGEFADRLLDEERVAVVPGEAFGEEGRGFVRLSYAGDAGELREGVARLRAFAERVWNPITGHHTATYHPMEVLA